MADIHGVDVVQSLTHHQIVTRVMMVLLVCERRKSCMGYLSEHIEEHRLDTHACTRWCMRGILNIDLQQLMVGPFQPVHFSTTLAHA